MYNDKHNDNYDKDNDKVIIMVSFLPKRNIFWVQTSPLSIDDVSCC